MGESQMNRRELMAAFGAMGVSATCCEAHEQEGPAGHGSAGSPSGNHHLHFCGIHVAKKDPTFQIITQHYCGPIAGGVFQCLLYDSQKKDAKLLGVEYIVSDEVYRKLPEEEKKYWHPHTYEVLGGGLIAPAMTPDAELGFMKALLTTWGKTWHTWPDPKTPVPMGEPLLIWSLTGDGQTDEKIIAARDKEFGVKCEEIRKKRIAAIGYEPPNVPAPKSLDFIGRQWTDEGEDKPTAKKG
jgi:hypothetical protein